MAPISMLIDERYCSAGRLFGEFFGSVSTGGSSLTNSTNRQGSMNATKTKPAKKQAPKLHQPGLFDGQETEKPAGKTTAKAPKSKKEKTNPQARPTKRKTQRQAKKKPETLKIPTLQEAIDQWDDVTGVAPECEIMPMNSEATTIGLCESIRAGGQAYPIHLDTEGRLLNGRHRLIACCALGIVPEFKTVDPGNPLLHVLADTHQREYNAATRASIALKVEAFLKQRCKEIKELHGDDILDKRRVNKERSIDTGGTEPTLMYAGDTLRDAAIRMAGSKLSAVRRLKTVMNKDPDLAEQAITGKITLKDAEEELKSRQVTSGKEIASSVDTADSPPDDGETSQEPQKHATATASPLKSPSDAKPTSSSDEVDEVPYVSEVTSPETPSIRERKLSCGLIEYSHGSRSVIFIPIRYGNKGRCCSLLLSTANTTIKRQFKDEAAARKDIERYLAHDD